MATAHKVLGHRALRKRSLMAAVCGDAISASGAFDPSHSHAYRDLVYEYGMPESQPAEYAAHAAAASRESAPVPFFNELALLRGHHVIHAPGLQAHLVPAPPLDEPFAPSHTATVDPRLH